MKPPKTFLSFIIFVALLLGLIFYAADTTGSSIYFCSFFICIAGVFASFIFASFFSETKFEERAHTYFLILYAASTVLFVVMGILWLIHAIKAGY